MRHDHIEYSGGEVSIVLKRLVSFAAIAGADHSKTFLLQNRGDQTKDRRIIVGHQHPSSCRVVVGAQLCLRNYAASMARPLSPALIESSAASLIAAIILECSAMPLPAMSKA